jgi:hypothetical protein
MLLRRLRCPGDLDDDDPLLWRNRFYLVLKTTTFEIVKVPFLFQTQMISMEGCPLNALPLSF